MNNNTFFTCKCIIYLVIYLSAMGLMTTAALATSFAGLATLAPLAMAASALHSAAFRHLIGCWLLVVITCNKIKKNIKCEFV
jgi:acyl-CoA thioesterase